MIQRICRRFAVAAVLCACGVSPSAAQMPDAPAVSAALDSLDLARRALTLGLYFGDPEAMQRAGDLRSRALGLLDQASADPTPRYAQLTWPDRERWLAVSLSERRMEWSTALYRAANGELPPEGSPSRAPFALALALTILEANADSAEAARTALLAAADPDYLLWDEAVFRLWRLDRARSDSLGELTWANQLCDDMPRSLRAPHTRITRARALVGTNQLTEALEENRLAIPVADGPETRTFNVRTLLAMDRAREASIELEYLIGHFPSDSRADAAMTLRLALGDMHSDLALSPEDRIRLWESLLVREDSGAREALTVLIEDASLSQEVRNDAALRLCRSDYKAKRYSAATPMLTSLSQGDDAVAAEATLILARIYRNTGQIDQMTPLYRRLAAGSRYGDDALWELGREYESEGDYAAAAETYGAFISRYPGHPRARDATFRRGFDRYRLGELDPAVADFRAALGQSTAAEDIEQAAYWLARTLKELGRDDEALRAAKAGTASAVPSDFYGVRLRTEYGWPVPPIERAVAAPVSAQTSLIAFAQESGLSLPARTQVLRGLALAELGLVGQARQEWDRAATNERSDSDLHAVLTFAAVAYDVYPEAVRWAGRTRSLLPAALEYQEGFERFTLPAAYYGEVMQRAQEFDLDPTLFWALMRQESLYDPLAVSPAGARGVMQLMPATLERMTVEGSAPALPTSALFRPDINIALGTRFLHDRYLEFNGELLPTLASYNAGENKVRQWIERAGGDQDAVFVECIGYPETHKYVRRIPWLQWKYESYYAREESIVAPPPESR